MSSLIPEKTDKTMNYHLKTQELSGKWVSLLQGATVDTGIIHCMGSKEEVNGIQKQAKELLYREVWRCDGFIYSVLFMETK